MILDDCSLHHNMGGHLAISIETCLVIVVGRCTYGSQAVSARRGQGSVDYIVTGFSHNQDKPLSKPIIYESQLLTRR